MALAMMEEAATTGQHKSQIPPVCAFQLLPEIIKTSSIFFLLSSQLKSVFQGQLLIQTIISL